MAIEKRLVSSNLADTVERVLDRGAVIDAAVRVALIGVALRQAQADAMLSTEAALEALAAVAAEPVAAEAA